MAHGTKLLAAKPKGPEFNSWNPYSEREDPTLESCCLTSVGDPEHTNKQIDVKGRNVKAN